MHGAWLGRAQDHAGRCPPVDQARTDLPFQDRARQPSGGPTIECDDLGTAFQHQRHARRMNIAVPTAFRDAEAMIGMILDRIVEPGLQLWPIVAVVALQLAQNLLALDPSKAAR